MQHQRRFAIDPPKRVLALGCPGSGRAKIAELLASKFDLPIVALDKAPSVTEDLAARGRRISEAVSQARWMVTTNGADALDLSVGRAEWLIFLDMPMTVCLARIFKDVLVKRGADTGVDGADGLWSAMRKIWTFPTDAVPRIISTIERERRNRTIFILRSRRDVSRFVVKLPDADDPPNEASETGAPSG